MATITLTANRAMQSLPARFVLSGRQTKVPNKRHLPITPSTRIIPGDLRDEAFCQRRVSEAVRGLGGLDIIVSNAGRQQSHEMITDISVEHFDWTITSRRPYRYANQLPPATGCSHSSSARSS